MDYLTYSNASREIIALVMGIGDGIALRNVKAMMDTVTELQAELAAALAAQVAAEARAAVLAGVWSAEKDRFGEYVHSVRMDWSNFDGRDLRDEWNAVRDAIDAALTASPAAVGTLADVLRAAELDRVRALINPDADGLIGGCVRCGKKVPFDFVVEDEFWDRIVLSKEWRRDVLCLPCLDEIACIEGENVHKHLILIYFTGLKSTSAFIANDALRAARKEQPQ